MSSITQSRYLLRGVHNFLPTPFLPDHKVDLYGMRENVVYHADTFHTDMVVTVCGGFGEGLQMDVEEQKDIVSAAVDGAGGRVPITAVALGGYGMQRRLAINAQETGASTLRVRFPTFGTADSDNAYSYLKGLAESADIGMVIFVMGEHNFWPDVFERLSGVSNIIGFSPPGGADSSDQIGKAIQHRVPNRYIWINENEQSAMKSFSNGCEGYTTAVSSIIPKSCKEFWDYGISGDTDQMLLTFNKLIKPIIKIRTVGRGCEIGGIKVALEALGRYGGPTRLPEFQVSKEDRKTIVDILRQHPETKELL